MIPEREREALMRLTMCAREECGMCKYKDTCNFDFQYETATRCMNILADALRKTEPQYDIDKGTIKCDNCSENGSYKCSKCDGEIYFKRLEVDDEPQIDGAIDEARFKAHCMNCQRDVADIKCLDCDGDKYFIADEPQTDCSWK